MQEELDERILKQHGNVYDEKIAKQNEIALFVELGELMNELPMHFKHWKKNAVDNRENALVEYVDALHFQLSLFNYCGFDVEDGIHNYKTMLAGRTEDINACLIDIVDSCFTEWGLSFLFDLGYILGFTWEEIYDTYKAKNKINHERQNNNY